MALFSQAIAPVKAATPVAATKSATPLNQAQVEAALRPLGFTGSATGGAAQAFINANPNAAAAINQAISGQRAPSGGSSVGNTPAIGATRQSNGTSDAGNTGTFYTETWDGTKWVKGSLPSATTTTPALTWNKDVATSVGQLLGIIPQGTVASGGYLDAKVAELRKTNPALAAEYDKIANGIQQGTMNQDSVMNYFIDREYKNQSTDYGSLAKAPYRTFTPFAEQAPSYKPFALSDFMASPDYEFRLEQGQNAIDRAGSARGNFYSGGALKEASKFAGDLASGEYNNARNNYVQDYGIRAGEYGDKYSRYNQDFSTGYGQAAADSDRIYNRYAGIAGQGAGTANAAVNANLTNADMAGTTLAATAQNRANAGIAGANNITQLLANSFGTSSYGKKK